MKKLVLTFCLVISANLSANLSAETHGGVLISNALMKGVTDYALEQGGSLYRVLSVKKIINTDKFEIAFGGQDSRTGKESISYKLKVKAEIKADESGATYPYGEIQIREIK